MTAPSTAVPPRTIYRVARREKVWDWPERAAAGPDRTFGNRFDDCEGLYRVLYTATRPYGCYLFDERPYGIDLDRLAPNDKSDFSTGHIYPMMLAGRLVGAICTGEREGGEAMPPHVDATIARIADAVAITLSAIESDFIREQNRVLRARLDELGRLAPPR